MSHGWIIRHMDYPPTKKYQFDQCLANNVSHARICAIIMAKHQQECLISCSRAGGFTA